VETHSFIGPKHTGKDRILPKNLIEERIKTQGELVDVTNQIADIVTTLFRKRIVYTDTAPANFARNHDGKVKIVDFDAEHRSSPGGGENHTKVFELIQIGNALAYAVNELYARNKPQLARKENLRKELEHTVLKTIEKNIADRNDARKIAKYFQDSLRVN
jgi:hypothetical protein